MCCFALTSLFDVHRSQSCYNKPRTFNLPCQSNLSVCAAAIDLGRRRWDPPSPGVFFFFFMFEYFLIQQKQVKDALLIMIFFLPSFGASVDVHSLNMTKILESQFFLHYFLSPPCGTKYLYTEAGYLRHLRPCSSAFVNVFILINIILISFYKLVMCCKGKALGMNSG